MTTGREPRFGGGGQDGTTPSPAAGGRGRLGLGGWLIIAALIALLVGSVAMAVRVWTGADVAAAASGAGKISAGGMGAIVAGVVGSLLVGGGLMALVFFSSRSGHDEAVHEEARQRTPDEP